jgi:hypothetical protein
MKRNLAQIRLHAFGFQQVTVVGTIIVGTARLARRPQDTGTETDSVDLHVGTVHGHNARHVQHRGAVDQRANETVGCLRRQYPAIAGKVGQRDIRLLK